MGFIDEIKARAKADKKTIILPETEDERTYKAAEAVLKEGIADLILIGNKEDIEKKKGTYDISGAKIVDPAKNDKTEAYIAKLVELRQKKGMTEEQARELLMSNYIYYGVMMVKMGDADGMVSGACHSTADTLRPCLQILKTKPGTKLVSAFFLMVVPDCDMGANGTFIFGDAGLEQNPDPEKLANIALSSAESFRTLTGKEPIVAMLSHSTKGSAKHPDVDKVVEATKLAHELDPELKLDGELQLDAAIVPEVGASKAPGSTVAGHANVLIFPDLDAGNIGYKLVQRLGKAEAYGPLTQGIAAPVNDLSRGCSAEDIVGVVAITAVQAQAQAQ
ncbi:MAG TPA: phosphate acetyltransferase [Candidatus Mediterraneibacter faecigallinarum]|jgi:phosphate acetyltransferase|uniref:Phosphate acetyltransferase n=1 Tax=Candidatus Mediterraneibacter faecigallinarum TaxID=2838669 RepID=A0A9D2NXQ1_9FIRM|nr:phosphate acetyltransferase [Candidatus Mediterraneibacter faecigallinarum]